MGRLVGPLLALVLATEARGETDRLVSAGVGAGWDTNPTGASTAGFRGGAALTYARLAAGARLGDAVGGTLRVEVGYEGTLYPDLRDLTLHRPFASAAWRRAVGARTALRLSATGGARIAGDPARSGWDAGGAALLRLRVASPVTLLLGGGYTHRAADDPVFAWDAWRANGGVEVLLGRRGYAIAAYTATFGRDTFYVAAPGVSDAAAAAGGPGSREPPGSGAGPGEPGGIHGGTGPGGRRAIPVTTFGAGVLAYSADRVAHTASLHVGLDVTRSTTLEAGYAYADVRGEVQRYVAHLFTADASWRY